MVKKKEIASFDTPRRRSKRLMKLKADNDPPEDFNQQSSDVSLNPILPTANCPKAADKRDSATAINDDTLEDLAINVFKNMKCVLGSSSEANCKPSASVEQQSEMLMLESVKTCRRVQL